MKIIFLSLFFFSIQLTAGDIDIEDLGKYLLSARQKSLLAELMKLREDREAQLQFVSDNRQEFEKIKKIYSPRHSSANKENKK